MTPQSQGSAESIKIKEEGGQWIFNGQLAVSPSVFYRIGRFHQTIIGPAKVVGVAVGFHAFKSLSCEKNKRQVPSNVRAASL